MAKRPGDRSGVCICGAMVADHFTKTGRKRSCEDVLRLLQINAQRLLKDGPDVDTELDDMAIESRRRRTIRIVKSDRWS